MSECVYYTSTVNESGELIFKRVDAHIDDKPTINLVDLSAIVPNTDPTLSRFHGKPTDKVDRKDSK